MTEADIVYQLSETFNRVWSMQQWWASISFGLVILAHVAVDRLSGLLIAVLVALYSGFTLFVFQMLGRNWQAVVSYVGDLRAMEESGHQLAQGTLAYMQPQSPLVTWAIILTIWGTFVGCNAYLVYSYVRGKRNSAVAG